MELNKIKQLPDLKIISSSESNCLIYKDIIFKIFINENLTEDRIDIINYFINNKIDNCPIIYDLIYDNEKIVGYSMEYYKKAVSINNINRLKILKEKCLELINVYTTLKNNNNICYIDFNRNNVFINNNQILLLDIDSSLMNNNINEEISIKLLIEFIISLIYKTYFFENEIYFSIKERLYIRNILCNNINTIDNLITLINDISKKDIKHTLKKIPYKIK